MCFEFDYWVTTDGGALSNGTADSAGYGSCHLESRTGHKQMIRLDFGRGVTNNEVEYRTLIATLKDLVGRIHRAGKPPSATETEPDPLVGISLFFFPGTSPVTPTPHGQPLDFGGGTHSAADEVWCSAWNACSGGQLAGPSIHYRGKRQEAP